jgi:hypothetical protein
MTIPFVETLSTIQGAYYLLTGIWPIVSIRTFQIVTGPKTDLWLVKTVGVLITVIGVVLMSAGLRGNTSPEIFTLAIGSAIGLTIIDVKYVSDGTIRRIYLLDAAAEMLLIAAWLLVQRA